MAKVPFLSEHVNMPRIMLNVESVGLSPEQFFRLCRDNPEMRIELTAQKEIVIMWPTNMKTGMLNAEITWQLVDWAQCLDQPYSVSADPELPTSHWT